MAEGTDQELMDTVDNDEDSEISKIKDEIVDTRIQMGETIDELQERLSVPVLTAHIKEEVSEQIQSAVQTTKVALRDGVLHGMNKIMNKLSNITSTTGGTLPLLLIGAGTGLMIMNRRRTSTSAISRGNDSSRSGVSGQIEGGEAGNSTLQGVRNAASSAYHTVEGAISSTADKVGDLAAAGKTTYVSYFDRNPLAVGAIAAAMGLAVGLALPMTETEAELLGETAGSLRSTVEEAAFGTVDKLKDSASQLLENVGGSEASGAQKGVSAEARS